VRIAPEVAGLFAAATLFAAMASIYILFPDRVKRWREERALFEMQKQASRIYSANNYRTFGWFFAVLSALMLIVALGGFLGF
jgi:hypothetical protein